MPWEGNLCWYIDMNEENAKFRKVYLVTGSHSELASEEVNLDTVDDFDPHLVM